METKGNGPITTNQTISLRLSVPSSLLLEQNFDGKFRESFFSMKNALQAKFHSSFTSFFHLDHSMANSPTSQQRAMPPDDLSGVYLWLTIIFSIVFFYCVCLPVCQALRRHCFCPTEDPPGEERQPGSPVAAAACTVMQHDYVNNAILAEAKICTPTIGGEDNTLTKEEEEKIVKAVCLSSLESNNHLGPGQEEDQEHVEEGTVMENFQADGMVYYIDEESGDVYVRGEDEEEMEIFRARASHPSYLTSTSYY